MILVTWLKQWMNALSHMISFNGFITLIHFYRSGNDFWQLWDLKFEQGISRTYSVSGECVRNNVSRKGQSVEKVDWDVFNFENHLLHLSFTSSYLILLLLPTFSYTSSPTSFYLTLSPVLSKQQVCCWIQNLRKYHRSGNRLIAGLSLLRIVCSILHSLIHLHI